MPAAANGTTVTETGMPEDSKDASTITPEDTILFTRQVAADNTSMVGNYSSWIPQAGHEIPGCSQMTTIFKYQCLPTPHLVPANHYYSGTCSFRVSTS